MFKLLARLKKYWYFLIIIVGLIFLQVLTDLQIPAKMNQMSMLLDKPNTQISDIMKIGWQMIGFACAAVVCAVTTNSIVNLMVSDFCRGLRQSIFDKVQTLSITEFESIGTASFITRTTNDVNQIQQLLSFGVRMTIMPPIMVVLAIIKIDQLRSDVTSILYVSAPAIVLVVGITIAIAVPLFAVMQKKIDKLTQITRENLTGVRVIRAFNRQIQENQRFNAANKDVTATAIKVNRIMSVLNPLIMLIINLSILMAYYIGSIKMNGVTYIDTEHFSGSVTGLVAVGQYITSVMFSIIFLANVFILFPRADASAKRINQVLGLVPTIVDNTTKEVQTSQRGHIVFDDVSMTFVGAEKPVLSGISFEASVGQTVAIIGSTGSGKSTLVNLMERFYDINNGQILINGVPHTDYTQQQLRSKIGIVPQQAMLFSGTVRQNIQFGKHDATDEEINQALKIAQAYDFVSALENGLDATVAQGGKNFSGGQKQRLCIARAVVRNPEFYVFDDSFSALDVKTDAKLRAALKDVTKDSTVLIVAQRVSTVLDADLIIVLDEGKIVGKGTHKELLDACQTYKEIVYSQLDEEEVNSSGK